MDKLLKKIKQARGTSLIELLVAVTLFTFMMLAATQIFKMVIDGQRSAISAQNVQENIRYAMEKMSKEIRMAQKSDTGCLASGVYKVFNTANGDSELYFKNQYGNCVIYYLENNRLKIMAAGVAGFITPAKVEVSNLRFYVIGDRIIDNFHSTQSYVTMVMTVKAVGLALNEQIMKLQMTVSSRYYE